jgi:hypothetical protein
MASSPTTCGSEIYSAIGRCPSSNLAEALIGEALYPFKRGRSCSQKVDDPTSRLLGQNVWRSQSEPPFTLFKLRSAAFEFFGHLLRGGPALYWLGRLD